MSKAKKNRNDGAYEAVAYLLSFLIIGVAALAVWMSLDTLGAMFRTAVQAVWDSSERVQNYVLLKKDTSYTAHIILRAILTSLVYIKFKAKLKRMSTNPIVRVVVFVLLLESLEFSAYLLEFVAIAIWNALVSVFNSIEVPNILKFGYFDTIDPLARFAQAFVCANVWFICKSVMKKRPTTSSRVAREAELEERAYYDEEHAKRAHKERLFNSTIEGNVSAPPRSAKM